MKLLWVVVAWIFSFLVTSSHSFCFLCEVEIEESFYIYIYTSMHFMLALHLLLFFTFEVLYSVDV